jgi:CubicO group peptidase (beta-lactamase class C family)
LASVLGATLDLLLSFFAPGTAAAYSNRGFDLLGAALASAGSRVWRASQNPDHRPLSMADTGLRLDEAQKSRLMTGYDFDGNPMEPFEAREAQGASGRIYSTPDDMVGFMRWHLDRREGLSISDQCHFAPGKCSPRSKIRAEARSSAGAANR